MPPLSEQQLTTVFRKFDADGSGVIDGGELRQAMASLGIKKKAKEVKQLMSDIGCDGEGTDEKPYTMDFKKFRTLMTDDCLKSDGKEEGVLSKVMGNFYVIRGKMIFTFLLSIYTMYSLQMAYNAATRKDLMLSKDPPSDRCVPFFDSVKSFAEAHPNDTEVLYDYRSGEILARVCTDVANETVIADIGNSTLYSPWEKLVQRCDVRGNETARMEFIENCIPEDTDETCEELLNTAPIYEGINWRHSLKWRTVKATNETVVNGTDVVEELVVPCTVRVKRVSGVDNCTRKAVLNFRETNRDLGTFLLLTVLVPYIVVFVQVCVLILYVVNDYSTQSLLVAYALEGIPGPPFRLFWYIKKKDSAILDDFMTTPTQWMFLFLQDGLEGLAAPIVAVWGCNLDRFLVDLLLVLFKIIKMIWDGLQYWADRKKTATLELHDLSQKLLEVAPNNSTTEMTSPVGQQQGGQVMMAAAVPAPQSRAVVAGVGVGYQAYPGAPQHHNHHPQQQPHLPPQHQYQQNQPQHQHHPNNIHHQLSPAHPHHDPAAALL